MNFQKVPNVAMQNTGQVFSVPQGDTKVNTTKSMATSLLNGITREHKLIYIELMSSLRHKYL